MIKSSMALRLMAASLLSGTMMLGVGCSKKAPAPVAIRNQDGSITNPDGSVTYPAGVTPPASAGVAPTPNQAVTVPAGAAPTPTPAPAAQQPTPAAAAAVSGTAPSAAPAPVRLTVPAGTAVSIRTNEALAASRNEPGDRFTAVLERPLIYHGETIYKAGTPVSGEVVASKGKGRFKGAGALGIELTAIGRERVSTSEYEQVDKGRGKRTAGFIGGGGGLGALIGGIAGGGKGALIGGLAGAGAGTAASAYSGSRDVIIRPESVITFRLRTSLTK